MIEQLEPYDVGWFSHTKPFESDIHNFEYADDSNRFWGGTPSVASYITAANSINSFIALPNIPKRLMNADLVVQRKCSRQNT